MKKVFTIPNIISLIRLLCTPILFLCTPFEAMFYLIYSILGITDALDGFLARKLNQTSSLGAFLDSLGDVIYFLSITIIILLNRKLPIYLWIWIGFIFIIKLVTILVSYLKNKKICFYHTYINKMMGLMIFISVFLIPLIPFHIIGLILCSLGNIACIEELLISIFQKNYEPNIKSILILRKEKRNASCILN